MTNDLTPHLSTGERAIMAEVLAHEWANRSQIDNTVAAMLAKRLAGPLNKALLNQRLITSAQCQKLEEFLHKDMRVGDFQVDRKIGSGAMGDVFLAHRISDQAQVALKLISKRFGDDEQFVKRFEREIHALSGLHHQNIAAAVGFGTHEALPFLAMEFVPGPSLAQLLDEHGPLPETYVLRISIQIAHGLDHIYQQTQLVHRDIKPENILTVPADTVSDDLFERLDSAKLIDFGLARSYSTDERLTMTGITMGTPHYMSPEQIRGSQLIDHRSDIYGVGATMYNLLTGRTPYDGASPGAVMTAHLTEPIPDPRKVVPGISEGTRDLVMMCMAKEADNRYLAYAAFIKACEEQLERLGEGPGSGMRLLRKPLVLNKPKRSPKSERRMAVSSSASEARTHSSGSEARAAAPGSEGRISSSATPSPEARRAAANATAGRLSFPDENGSDAKAGSSSQTGTGRTRRKEQASSGGLLIPETDHLLRREASQRRLDEETLEAQSLAIMPMMILGAAVVALLAILVWRTFF